jgi:two-component system CheB/CheR fusion protein
MMAVEQEQVRVAVLGGSAGSVDAFAKVLAGLPPQCGFAVLVVSHLDPNRESQLSEVLQPHTPMPVERLTHLRKIEHDKVYVLPEDTSVTALDGHFRLSRRAPGLHLPIDISLASLAQDPDVHAAAVILSGTGADGAAGIAELKATGGLVIAQSPSTAQYDGMPTAAINTGLVDEVLALDDIAAVLVERFGTATAAEANAGHEDYTEALNIALAVVQQKTGINLGYIKDVNLRRRFLRRVMLQKDRDVKAYLQQLRTDPREASALRDDILIGVTAFFRDTEFVNVLRLTVIPKLIEGGQDPIRIWVPACSTGEEVYTVAMLVKEGLDAEGIKRKVQIFGTDINENSIEVARGGRYVSAAVDNVPEAYRAKAFVPTPNGFLVKKDIREMCVFARHNLLTHAPFSGMSLITCRNLMIYLRKEAQQHVLEVLHYATRADGFVMLGRAEAASAADGFEHAGAPHLYRKLAQSKRQRRVLPADAMLPWSGPGADAGSRARVQLDHLEQAVNRCAIERYVPPGFVVNEIGDVVQFRGDVAAFLAPASGEATLVLARLLRPELNVPARTALLEAKQSGLIVRRERVQIEGRRYALEALPLTPEGDARHFLVTLQLQPDDDANRAANAAYDNASSELIELQQTVATLSDELETAQAQLKAMVVEFESANEELRTSNEEMLSANEELQSANEELESAKQELESANQELNSLNEEMRSRNDQLAVANDDLGNLVEGIPLPVVLLDRQLRLRHFSPQAASLFGLLAESVGQPMPTLNDRFAMSDIERLVQAAVQGLSAVEREFRDADGRWWLVNVRAYRTADERIDGAVIAFQDVDELKAALSRAQIASQEAERANAAKDDFLALVSHELRAPLNVISGWASVLRKANETAQLNSDMADKPLQIILKQCQIQAQLIDDLLDVSRISSGRLALETRPVDIGACVGGVIEGMQPQAKAKDIELVGSGLISGYTVQGDARRLAQIASNLIGNALKFTPSKGRVEVAITRVNQTIELSVADTGIGVAPELLPHLFERFTQSDMRHTREYGGLGLGLSIVKHLVTAHGGTVTALSDGEGRGTRVIVRLQRVDLATRQPVPLTVPAQVDSDLDLSILLVDDESEGRDALSALLKMTGARVTSAGSVEEALQTLGTAHFDAIVSDIAMPGRSGYDLIRAVREREAVNQSARTYAVALSGLASLQDRDAAIAAGFDDHTPKPVEPQVLIERLSLARGRKG